MWKLAIQETWLFILPILIVLFLLLLVFPKTMWSLYLLFVVVTEVRYRFYKWRNKHT